MILDSKGFRIGNYFFEPFSVKNGDYIVINMPSPLDFDIEKSLHEILNGQNSKSEVLTNEVFVPVVIPVQKSRIGLFSKLTALDYLLKETDYSSDEVRIKLESYDLDPRINIYKLGANERMLLALEKSYNQSKNIILTTAGLDYNGLNQIKERIRKELAKGSLIEINYESSRGREFLFEEPSKVVEVKSHELST